METRKSRGAVPGIVTGAILVVIGGLFVLDRLGVIEAGDLFDYWPMVLIGMGVTHLLAPRDSGDWAWGAVMLAAGAFFQARRLDWIDVRFGEIWPVFLIFAGLGLILESALRRRRDGRSAPLAGENGG